MNKKKLLTLISQDEGTKLDFKRELCLEFESCKKELAKDVCAIANSSGGRGFIIVGVEDKSKKIIGVKDIKSINEEKIQQVISSRCEPPIPITVDTIEVDEKIVGVITIFDGGQKPYQIKDTGAFNIRRGSITDTMRKDELVAAFEENLALGIETCPVMRSSTEFLNMELVSKYFKSKGIYINKENKEFLLESAGITYSQKSSRKIKCTFGGLLVFSDINNICIPYNMVKIVNRNDSNKDNVIIVQGNLINIIHKAEKELMKLLPNEYPIFAVMEALKNAVLYREYSQVNRVIEVVISYKTIIITSPGQMVLKNSRGQSISYNRRNMWIYDKLISLDDDKVFINNGGGLKRIKEAFRGRGRVKFINSTIEDCFKVILPYIKVNNSNENENNNFKES